MNEKKVRYGFIGCGMMGQEHLRNLALVNGAAESTGAVVTAIFEPDSAMQQLAASFAPAATFEPSFESILARTDIDAWVITSPNHCHAAQLAAIAATHPKPTLLEKPACIDLAGVSALQALANATSKAMPIWTAMEYRYMPPIAKLIEEAHKATYTGEAVMFSIREHRYPFLTKVGDWNRFNKNTGGTLVEKCCHFFDLMRHVMQADPIRVYASGGQNHNHLDEQYTEGNQVLVPDILDNAYVVLDFPPSATGSGLPRRAMLDLCMFAEGARYQEELIVVGAKGKLECKVPGPGRFWPTELGDAPTAQLTVSQRHKTGEDGWTNNPSITAVPLQTLNIPVDPALLAAGDHNGSTFYQHKKFFEMVQRVMTGDLTAAPELSLQDGLKAVLIGLAAQESARTGEAVSLIAGSYKL